MARWICCSWVTQKASAYGRENWYGIFVVHHQSLSSFSIQYGRLVRLILRFHLNNLCWLDFWVFAKSIQLDFFMHSFRLCENNTVYTFPTKESPDSTTFQLKVLTFECFVPIKWLYQIHSVHFNWLHSISASLSPCMWVPHNLVYVQPYILYSLLSHFFIYFFFFWFLLHALLSFKIYILNTNAITCISSFRIKWTTKCSNGSVWESVT